MPTDAIREAMATVRDYWSHKPVDRDRYNEACQTLARWLVQHAGELVRLKPLEWKGEYSRNERYANTPFGPIVLIRECGWWYSNESAIRCQSLDQAKERIEKWYNARLAAALEPLFPTETDHADN